MADDRPRTRRERIEILLENYVDVEAGIHDLSGADAIHLPLMCRAWNHPSYKQLVRLLWTMRGSRHQLYQHISRAYFQSTQRRVLQCPRCRGISPAWSTKNFHKHGHSNVAVVPRVVRVVRANVRVDQVSAAVAWLDEQWVGDVFLPDELVPSA